MIVKNRNITLSSLFGLAIFSQKVLLPAPYDKMASILIQIVFLSLAFLIIGFMGPILTSFISGLLTASIRGGFGLLTFSFALLYGVIVSLLNYLFRVKDAGEIRRRRLITSSLISTILIGVISSILSIFLGIIKYDLFLISVIMISGAVQGLVGGYLSIKVWERYFHTL